MDSGFLPSGCNWCLKIRDARQGHIILSNPYFATVPWAGVFDLLYKTANDLKIIALKT